MVPHCRTSHPQVSEPRSCRPARRLRRQGREGKVELLTGIEGASSRPVRRIVLIDGLGYVMPATRRESTSQLTSSWRNAVVFTKGR
jgi:hypothetical protein